ncbi:hypothetical protein [Parazoarcus communis]|nr:hypothetical protein [Parazoarcus communis]
MDFGAHDVDTSRRFYFPSNSAYILLEVSLPKSGTVVLGCVGKGVSHDYEYFAYRGELALDDFRLPDGTTVAQPQLAGHMAQLGRLVFSYSSSEFADVLYGGRRGRRPDHEPDFTVFKLEQPSNAAVFQKVLTRTLRLDRLTSTEVKAYLLEIFRHDLSDASIDFKAEWDKAFADVNAERAQYDAALRQRPLITQLEQCHAERSVLRGKVLHFRPIIDALLVDWDAYQRSELESLRSQLAQVERLEADLQERDRNLVRRQTQDSEVLRRLQQQTARMNELANKFDLIPERRVLEERLVEARGQYDSQAALVVRAASRGAATIRREIESVAKQRQRLADELATLADNLYLRLHAELEGEELERLNRVLAKSVMLLPSKACELTPTLLRDWLRAGGDTQLLLPGLTLDLASLEHQHEQRSNQEIQEDLRELEMRAPQLEQELTAALALDAAKARKAELEREVGQIQLELAAFDELLGLRETRSAREEEIAALNLRLDEAKQLLDSAKDEVARMRSEQKRIQGQISQLEGQHRLVINLRNRRGDDDPMFDSLAEMPHQVWIGNSDVALSDLAEALQAYQQDCRNLMQLEERIHGHVATLHAGGLTKYQFSDSPEIEIQHIVGFANHLVQEAEALERKARTAVVNVTACLRQLRDGLRRFKSAMRDFNRLVSRRQLSDLAVFKIEPVDETLLVEAIEQLISTAEHAESGETFELFNHHSVLDDAALNRAKTLLIEEGAARGCLRVEHFFRLEFVVGKLGRKPESFTDIDSAASNGTVLMAKLVTGLALLHQMRDERHDVQAVCYLDEASALDQRNQRSLIDTAEDFGFALIFASPAPLITARYCVPITSRGGHNIISKQNWQIIEPCEQDAVAP